jgi:hypothetical protein
VRTKKTWTIDWRDPAAYAPLLDADRSLIAWEWLRRDRRYAEAALAASPARCRRASSGAAEFGLVAFEPPDLAVPHARPMWSLDVHPYVLSAVPCRPTRRGDVFDVGSLAGMTTLVAGEERDHLLLSDGLSNVRIDGPAGTFRAGSVCLHYLLEGIETAERPLLALQRFLALCRGHGFSRSLHPPERRARRWVLMLRAHDAFACGAGQREIAQELFSRTAGEPRWRSREPSIRSQAQRLVRAAREFSAGGYRGLLG